MKCKEKDCHSPIKARGLCFKHWIAIRYQENPELLERENARRAARKLGVVKPRDVIDPNAYWTWVRKELNI